jgi:hypothetical protein
MLEVSLNRKRFPERDPQEQLATRVGEGRVGISGTGSPLF